MSNLLDVDGPAFRRDRRKSVSSESMDPTKFQMHQADRTIIAKTDDALQRIQKCIKDIFLFQGMSLELKSEVLDAMFEARYSAGETIITQGEDGDNFYIIDTGEADFFVDIQGEQKLVDHRGPGDSFGELALMYNSPRAATVKATTDMTCWGVDRTTFRRIIMQTMFEKRQHYEQLLSSFPLLQSLEPYERVSLADAMEEACFSTGDVVLKQGEEGDSFFFVESGEATATIVEDGKEPVEVKHYKTGEYFGELALLQNQARAATVTAKTDLKLVRCDRLSFSRLVGPCEKILRRNVDNYEKVCHSFGLQPPIQPLGVGADDDDEEEEELLE
eukprot:GFYU01001496.1.p1 GENE.GFYU01001496.1~~GFYU01001496.1.p1  ORF type:complete len:331 (-),score=84.84 GFYU01001496.1:363-1355(-)